MFNDISVHSVRWNFPEIFGYPRLDEKSSMALPAVTLDIGFGCGDSLLGMASARPDDCFVGIEVSETRQLVSYCPTFAVARHLRRRQTRHFRTRY